MQQSNRYDLKRLNFLSFCCVAFVIAVIFLHSIERREPHLAGTWSRDTFILCDTCIDRHQWHMATTMIYVQNWLREGALNLKFLLVSNPKSIEMQTLNDRVVYPSFPVGAYIITYLWVLGMSVASQDILTDPSLQLLSYTALAYAAHLFFTCLLCLAVFRIMRRLRCNHLNASLIAIVPALVSFHSVFPLYYFHTVWDHSIAILPIYVLFVYFETLRYLGRLTRLQNFMQLATMGIGMFCDWLFAPVLLVVYALRIGQGWIGLAAKRLFIWQSLKFFALPALAVAVWLGQYFLYAYRPGLVFREGAREPILATVPANDYRLGEVILHRIGADSVQQFIAQLYEPLIVYVKYGYGYVGLIFLFLALYLVYRSRELRQGKVLCKLYGLLTLPVILHTLMLSNHAREHLFSSLRFAPAISVAIIVVVMLVAIRSGRDLRLSLFTIRGVPIYRTTVVCLVLAAVYVAAHYFHKPLRSYFSPPDYSYTIMGKFIRANSSYRDVLFSKQAIVPSLPPQRLAFMGKRVHSARDLDEIYVQTRQLHDEDFTIKILYLVSDAPSTTGTITPEVAEYRDIQKLTIFLNEQGIATKHTIENQLGMLEFSGQEFLRYYQASL
ncbi:MAG: hypothetical protein OYH77_07195 [Pseudomonadota bacterium]|nr:hypothetical protein [Pseudomonadota bacterium]